jgi:hypothetical protein
MPGTGTFTTNVEINIPGLGTVPIGLRWNLQNWESAFRNAARRAPSAFSQWRNGVQQEVGEILIAAVQNVILNEPAPNKQFPMNYTGYLMGSLVKRVTEGGRFVYVYPTAPYAQMMDTTGIPPGMFVPPTRAQGGGAAFRSQLSAARGGSIGMEARDFGTVPPELLEWCIVKMQLTPTTAHRVLIAIANLGVKPQNYMARAARNAEPIVREYIAAQARKDIPAILRRITRAG